jgi:hypothetical protein
MPYTQADPDQLIMQPLANRKSKSDIMQIAMNPEQWPPIVPELEPTLTAVAERILQARKQGASVMLAFGAHLLKNGAGPLLIRMMEQGWLTHLATQGAGSIHDWEFSFQRYSEEDVAANAANGTFGVWDETGRYLNLAVQVGSVSGMGYGESVGAMIHQDGLDFPDAKKLLNYLLQNKNYGSVKLPAIAELLHTMEKFNIKPGAIRIKHPYKEYSVFGNAFRLHVPITVHPGIGYDIIYNNPYANGAAIGRAANTDFNIFVQSVTNLNNGVFISVGSAIMAPQVFEKAVSFANNLKRQTGEKLTDHLIVINDLQPMTWDWRSGEPPKSSPDYYLRFLKSFSRMGGDMRYVSTDNRVFLHQLYAILQRMSS